MFGLCHQLAITLVYVHILIHKIKKYFFDEKPLICSDKTIIPVYLVLFVGGKQFILPPPPSLSLIYCSSSAFSGTDEQLFTRTAFTQ